MRLNRPGAVERKHSAAAAAAFSDRAAYAAQVLGTPGSTMTASGPVEAAASHTVSAAGLLADLGRSRPRSAWPPSPSTGGRCGSAGGSRLHRMASPSAQRPGR